MSAAALAQLGSTNPAVLVAAGSVWSYLDNGSEPGTDPDNKPPTLVANVPPTPPQVELTTPLDGTVFPSGDVYIGAEASDLDGYVYRIDFYAGPDLIGSDTTPPFGVIWTNPPAGRYRLHALAIDNSGLRDESEVVHIQVGELTGDRVVRGPYLQTAATNSVIVCWRTDWFQDAQVEFGTDLADLDRRVVLYENVTDHAVRLTKLQPDTKYFYAIGTRQTRLLDGPDCFFRTPPVGAKPTRIWAIGDSGTADANARAVLESYAAYAGERTTDVWLMLGDNAYESGTDDQYQAAVFDLYGELLRSTCLWPTLGNHDDPEFSGHPPYFDIFVLPTRAEAGGLASGTERYYSFNHGNIHFICLDSHSSDRRPGSPMLLWLEQDLAATVQDWIIAYFHHPPYSFGTHDSDREYDLIQMRENVLPVLEAWAVDLVLAGHSHVYERSYLLQGHYGYSTDLEAAMILDSGSGRLEEEGPYQKPAGGLGAGQGTVYLVCGCSGEGSDFPLRRHHPAMYAALGGFGSVVIDIAGDRLDAQFLRPSGETGDHFTMFKETPPEAVPPELRIQQAGEEVELSWWTSPRLFQLETSVCLGDPWGWMGVTNSPSQTGRRHVVRWRAGGPFRAFRLREVAP